MFRKENDIRYDLTAAVLGTGSMGKHHIKVLSKNVKKLIICTNDEEIGKALSEEYGCKLYSDYNEMFESEHIDFVSVCLPTYLHRDASVAAMEHGINVLCEKPFASNADEAREMLELAVAKGLKLMIGHCERFTKRYEYIRRCVLDGRFGKVLSYTSWREHGMPKWSVGSWLANPALSGGIVRDLQIHDTDMIVGLFASPAIAEYVEKLLIDGGMSTRLKKDYNPTRLPTHYFREMSTEEKNEVIKENPRFGRIVCRCEGITEGEIADAILRNPGARDIDGVKRRTRSGMGRCQGGFCSPSVIEIIARECGVAFESVTKFGKGSVINYHKTKGEL